MGSKPVDLLTEFETPALIRCPLASPDLTGEDQTKLAAALAADPRRIHATRIAGWLRARQVDVSDEAVQRHRRGACRCR